MKALFSIFFIFLNLICFGQSCEQRLNNLSNAVNNIKTCEQLNYFNNVTFNKSEATKFGNECAMYISENRDKFYAIANKLQTIGKSLDCNGKVSSSNQSNQTSSCTATNQTVQQTNTIINQFKENPIAYSNSKTKDGTKLKDEDKKKLLENIESTTNIGEFDESKINEILDIKEDCDDFASYSEIVFKHNNYDISLSYSVLNKTKVTVNNKLYDQYEIQYKFTNNSGNYIHNPQICRINFPYSIKHPTSNSEMDFAENGEFWSYIEYTDGTQLPENLNSQREDNKYGDILTRRIIKKGVTSECTKYILVNKCEKLGKPSYTVEFNNHYPIIVQGTDQLIETWINRQAKGMSLNNVTSWPMTSRSLHEGYTHCNDAKPLFK